MNRHGIAGQVREHLASGEPIRSLKAMRLYGVANLPDFVKEMRHRGLVIHSRLASYAAAERTNHHAVLQPPANLPVREIHLTESGEARFQPASAPCGCFARRRPLPALRTAAGARVPRRPRGLVCTRRRDSNEQWAGVLRRPQPDEGGEMMLKLRPWQHEALKKMVDWLVVKRSDRHFLINAAPGAGTTIGASAIAGALVDMGEVDLVIVIAPRSEIVNHWSKDFRRVTGRHTGKVTARDGDIGGLRIDICATRAAVHGLQPELQTVCRASSVLVICDEHHHAAVRAAWRDSAFTDAKFVLVLTGAPIRSDGARSIWLPYDDAGAIDYPGDRNSTKLLTR